MMVIDEVNNLGWFATDRNQPEGMVCVYTFIPSETKEYYNYQEDCFETIRRAAQIHSIAATQTDTKAIQKAQQTLFKLGLEAQTEEKKNDFTFVIDDFTDYHSLDNFKSAEARQLYIDWTAKRESLNKLAQELEEKRERYLHSSSNDRRKMADELLQMEKQFEQLEVEVKNMPKEIRNLEISYVKK